MDQLSHKGESLKEELDREGCMVQSKESETLITEELATATTI